MTDVLKFYAVKALILNKNWEEASKYGDPKIAMMVEQNQDWIWENELSENISDDRQFDSMAYGNLAMIIHHGSKFPERLEAIEILKAYAIGLAHP